MISQLEIKMASETGNIGSLNGLISKFTPKTHKIHTAILAILIAPLNLIAQQPKQSVVIDGRHFVGYLKPWGFCLLNSGQDTVLNISEGFFQFKFNDFNRDGFKDVYLEWGGNSPERYSIYLYDPLSKDFNELKGFSTFPAATAIKGSKCYYSYSRGGCEDLSWNSDLFYIQKNTCIKIGSIHAEGCGSTEDGIFITRMEHGKPTPIKTLPLGTLNKYTDGKMGFIRNYWAKSHSLFL